MERRLSGTSVESQPKEPPFSATNSSMESLQDNPLRAKNSMNQALNNISTLLANFDDFESDRGEMKRTQDKVDTLLFLSMDQHGELSEDLRSMYAALRKSHMTPAELETLVMTEQEKSLFLLNLSSSVNSHLTELCKHVQDMAAQAHEGAPISAEYLDSLSLQVEMVNEQIGNVAKAASSPPKKFRSEPSFFSTMKDDHEQSMKKMKQNFDDIARRAKGSYSTIGGHHPPVSHVAKRRPVSAASSPAEQRRAEVRMEDKDCQTEFDEETFKMSRSISPSPIASSTGLERNNSSSQQRDLRGNLQRSPSMQRRSSHEGTGGGHASSSDQFQRNHSSTGDGSSSIHSSPEGRHYSGALPHTDLSRPGSRDGSNNHSRPGSALRDSGGFSRSPSGAGMHESIPDGAWSEGAESTWHEKSTKDNASHSDASNVGSRSESRPISAAGSRRNSVEFAAIDMQSLDKSHTGHASGMSKKSHESKSGGMHSSRSKHGHSTTGDGDNHKTRRGSKESLPNVDEAMIRAKDLEKLKSAKHTISSLERKVKDLEKQLKGKELEIAIVSGRITGEGNGSALETINTDEAIAFAAAGSDVATSVSSATSAVGGASATPSNVTSVGSDTIPSHVTSAGGEPLSSRVDGHDHQAAVIGAGQQTVIQNIIDGLSHLKSGGHSHDQPSAANQPHNVYHINGEMHELAANSYHTDVNDLASCASESTTSIGQTAHKLLRIAQNHEEHRDPVVKDCIIVGDSFKSLDSLQSVHYIANNSASVVSKSTIPRIIATATDGSQLAGLHYDDATMESVASGSIRLYSPGNSVANVEQDAQQDLDDRIVIPSIANPSSMGGSLTRAQSALGERSNKPFIATQSRPNSSNPRTNKDHLSSKRFDRNAKGVLNAYLAADRDVSLLRNKDAKWNEAKGFLKMTHEDKEVTTEDFELFLQDGAIAEHFPGTKIIVSKVLQQKTAITTMTDVLDNSPRDRSTKRQATQSGRGVPTLPRTESTQYKPTSNDVALLVPSISRLGVAEVAPDFDSDLYQSDRPLHQLYMRYKHLLPSNSKSSLMRAMYHELLHAEGVHMRNTKDTADADKLAYDNGSLPLYVPKSKQQINEFFAECIEMLVDLNTKSNGCLVAVQVCERSVAILISMARDPTCQADVYNRSLSATYKKLGTVGSLKLQVNLELAEYRTFFEGINSLSASSFNSMIKQCPDFKKSYQLFLDTQCQSVEFSARLTKLKTLCKQEKLFANSKFSDLGPYGSYSGGGGGGGFAVPDRNPASMLLEYPISPILSPSKERTIEPTTKTLLTTASATMTSSHSDMRIVVNSHAAQPKKLNGDISGISASQSTAKVTTNKDKEKLVRPVIASEVDLDSHRRIQELTKKVEELEEALDESKIDVISLINTKDLTPGALIFYSTLSDPISIITFKNLHTVLNEIKSFVHSSEHFDFATVRKKLLECVSSVPLLDRFISRYTELHKRWSERRFAMFTERGLQGGNADGFYTCPICNNDSRHQHGSKSDIHGLFPTRNKAQKLREGVVSAREPQRSPVTKSEGRAQSASGGRPTLRVPSAVVDDDVSLHSGFSKSIAESQYRQFSARESANL